MIKVELRTKRLIIKNVSPTRFSILDKSLREIGGIKHQNSVLGFGEIGYIILDQKDRNQGYMTEALKEVLEFYPSNMRVLTINHDNKASQRVAEKCGFVMQGYWNKQTQVWRHKTCHTDYKLY